MSIAVPANYIIVDLDGTLARTDLFIESVLKLVKQNPVKIFQLFFWLLRGRSYIKDRVAKLVTINIECLPYEQELLDYLREKKSQGKILVLATASHKIYADHIANHFGIFDQVIATDAATNLKGHNKLEAIREIVGGEDFFYAGDSVSDRPIWKEASSGIFVNACRRDVKNAESDGKVEKVIVSRPPIITSCFRQMRTRQWLKNVLVFVPLFTSHAYADAGMLLAALLAFIFFSLCASGVYFLNDLLDLEADRSHRQKRLRPLAAGDLPLFFGLIGAIALPLVSFALSWCFLPVEFLIVLVFYFLVTNAYSFFIKSISTADVMTLAVLYTLRIVSGAAAIDVELSSWLMAFSVFIFVSLAYLKRYIEISALPDDLQKAHGRDYTGNDTETMFSLGISNITASVLILALYINSQEVAALYRSPEILWLLCFLMLYWGNRIWVSARRGKIDDDPVIFVAKDAVSRIVGVAFLIVVIGAKYL